MNPAPMPWILCGVCWPPDSTGLSSGSTATIRKRRLARLQHLPDAGDGAAGADAGDEVVDIAAGVVPDFLGRGAAVNFGIGEVLELLRHHGIGRGAHQFLRGGDRALHALRCRRQDDFGAEERQHLAPLDRHRFRHHQLQPVAAGSGDEGQRDPGIARSRLDQHGVGIDQARLFHRDDHRRADAVLHAGGGIEIFQLGQDGRVHALRLRQFAQTDDRRIADCVDDASQKPGPGRDGALHSWVTARP